MTTLTRTLTASTALLAAGTGLAACSDGGGSAATTQATQSSSVTTLPGSTVPAPASTGRSITVKLGTDGIAPRQMVAVPGDAIVFRNTLAMPTHVQFLNLGSDGPAQSPELAPGATWTYVAPLPRSILFAASGVPGRPGHIEIMVSQ